MKIRTVSVIVPGIILSHFGRLAHAQTGGLPSDCFRYSDKVGSEQGVTVSNANEVMGSEFREDMRLFEITGCYSAGTMQLASLEFTLKSTEGKLKYLELGSIGSGAFCEDVQLEGGASVTYMEVTYSSKKINSFFAKLGKNENVLFGLRQSGDKTQSWGFDDTNVPIGLQGTINGDKITSLGLIVFRPGCDTTGSNPALRSTAAGDSDLVAEDAVNADGTFQFASRAIEFENDAVGPLQPRPEAEDIWSLDNPDLVDDVYAWAQEKPQMWYVLAGAAVVLILLICCVCACCRCCCACCCGVKTPNKVSIQDSKPLMNSKPGNSTTRDIFPEPKQHPKKSQNFGAKDVLNEQRTCEEFSEDDQTYPTARNLVSQDKHVSEKNAYGSNSHPNFVEDKGAAGNVSQDLQRKQLAEQIMYGSKNKRTSIIFSNGGGRGDSRDGGEYSDNNLANGKLMSQQQIEMINYRGRNDGSAGFNQLMSPPETGDSLNRAQNQFNQNGRNQNNIQYYNNGQRGMHPYGGGNQRDLSSPPYPDDGHYPLNPYHNGPPGQQNHPVGQQQYPTEPPSTAEFQSHMNYGPRFNMGSNRPSLRRVSSEYPFNSGYNNQMPPANMPYGSDQKMSQFGGTRHSQGGEHYRRDSKPPTQNMMYSDHKVDEGFMSQRESRMENNGPGEFFQGNPTPPPRPIYHDRSQSPHHRQSWSGTTAPPHHHQQYQQLPPYYENGNSIHNLNQIQQNYQNRHQHQTSPPPPPQYQHQPEQYQTRQQSPGKPPLYQHPPPQHPQQHQSPYAQHPPPHPMLQPAPPQQQQHQTNQTQHTYYSNQGQPTNNNEHSHQFASQSQAMGSSPMLAGLDQLSAIDKQSPVALPSHEQAHQQQVPGFQSPQFQPILQQQQQQQQQQQLQQQSPVQQPPIPQQQQPPPVQEQQPQLPIISPKPIQIQQQQQNQQSQPQPQPAPVAPQQFTQQQPPPTPQVPQQSQLQQQPHPQSQPQPQQQPQLQSQSHQQPQLEPQPQPQPQTQPDQQPQVRAAPTLNKLPSQHMNQTTQLITIGAEDVSRINPSSIPGTPNNANDQSAVLNQVDQLQLKVQQLQNQLSQVQQNQTEQVTKSLNETLRQTIQQQQQQQQQQSQQTPQQPMPIIVQVSPQKGEAQRSGGLYQIKSNQREDMDLNDRDRDWNNTDRGGEHRESILLRGGRLDRSYERGDRDRGDRSRDRDLDRQRERSREKARERELDRSRERERERERSRERERERERERSKERERERERARERERDMLNALRSDQEHSTPVIYRNNGDPAKNLQAVESRTNVYNSQTRIESDYQFQLPQDDSTPQQQRKVLDDVEQMFNQNVPKKIPMVPATIAGTYSLQDRPPYPTNNQYGGDHYAANEPSRDNQNNISQSKSPTYFTK